LVLERDLQGVRQLLHDLVGGVGRDVEPVPHTQLQLRQPGLGGGGQVRQHVDPLRRRHGIGLDVAGLDGGCRVGRLVAHEVDLATDQVGQGRPGAVVGHLREVDADRLLEQQSAEL